ncbi:hypothetical protein ACP70R_030863 [Stipagrostis hirtigluma subsp. patula]
MKRKVVQGNIMSFFAKAQKNSSSSTPATSERIQIGEGLVGESLEGRVTEENGSEILVTHSTPPAEIENTPPQDACPGPQDQDIPTDGSSERISKSVPGSESERIYDVDRLPHDPGKRMPISSYDVNDQDATVLHIVSMYSTIRKVLIKLGKDRSHKDDWGKIHAVCGAIESFDFIFMAHLMLVILGYTDDLCQSLQRKEQDIVNAMSLVQVAKGRLQHMRDAGWEEFLHEKVTSFCMKHRIKVPNPNHKYRPFGRDKRFYLKQTNDDHFRREVYLGVIDTIRQELDNRFDKVNMQLLVCISAFNPVNSFASYDKEQLMKLATFYPKEFSSTDLTRLSFQLDNFIDDMRLDGRFNDLKSLGELSVKLVETKKHLNHKMVYLLLKLVLLLPVATASVERVFSAMTFVKNKLRNRMGDQLLNDCLVTFIERDMFLKVTVLDVMKRFQNMADRRVKLNL